MKIIFTVVIGLCALTCRSQTFKKITDPITSHFYDITASCQIETGQLTKQAVIFSTFIEKRIWDSLIKKYKQNEAQYYNSIAASLSEIAKNSLKNPLSFVPFKSQKITFGNGRFICDYKMIGKNGFGSDAETMLTITYRPGGQFGEPEFDSTANPFQHPKVKVEGLRD